MEEAATIGSAEAGAPSGAAVIALGIVPVDRALRVTGSVSASPPGDEPGTPVAVAGSQQAR